MKRDLIDMMNLLTLLWGALRIRGRVWRSGFGWPQFAWSTEGRGGVCACRFGRWVVLTGWLISPTTPFSLRPDRVCEPAPEPFRETATTHRWAGFFMTRARLPLSRELLYPRPAHRPRPPMEAA